MTMMMMTNGNGDPFKNTTVKKVNKTDLRRTSVTESELCSFPALSLLPFPMRKKPGNEVMQKEEKDWRLKRKMGAIGKVPSVCFSSAKKTVRKRFFGDRFYAVK